MNKKILIGSNGGLTGIYLAKQFAKMGRYMVYGADSAEMTAGKLFVDKQCYVPSAGDPDFLDTLIDLLNCEKIDYYLPTHSNEMRKISEYADELRKCTNARFLVSPIATFYALESKEQAYYSLSAAKIPTPKMIIGEKGATYPLIMKNKFGSGSSSVLKIDNADIHSAFRNSNSDVCFFEYITGCEYTTDCCFDSKGVLLAYNVRERIKTTGGAVVITQNTMEINILPWLKIMEKQWRFCGCVNFQFIVQNDQPYFTDINLRYPSGGLPLTVRSGVNIPEMIIRLLNGETIAWGEYTVNQKVRAMYRYYEEVFDYDVD